MSGLRIVGGIARGRRLKSVPGDTTRPITDRAKESLFNIIGADISDAGGSSFLDLFGGTGSVGIEALSRGAAFVRFVDVNRLAVNTMQENLSNTGLAARAEVLRMDAFALLSRPADRAFEYIYIAPPQYKGLWKRALLAVDANPGWLSEDAWVIVQIHPIEYEEQDGGGELSQLSLFDERRYGSTLLLFYERK